jgi:lysozyme family protein
MANFETAVARTLEHEGVFSNDPDDNGGATKYGISQAAYPGLDIASLTIDDAKALYRRDYWSELQLDDIADQNIANELFDTAVNCGVHVAAEFVQEALTLFGKSIEVDGIVGPVTVAAVNRYPYPQALYKALNGLQFEYYHDIITRHPRQKKWFRGWLKRV